MMSTAPPFLLSHEQATRLQAYIQTYRQYAFYALLPSVERNVMLRSLQELQGKVITAMDQKTELLQLALTMEETTTLRTAVAVLLGLYAQQPESAARTATLADLAALNLSLKCYEGEAIP